MCSHGSLKNADKAIKVECRRIYVKKTKEEPEEQVNNKNKQFEKAIKQLMENISAQCSHTFDVEHAYFGKLKYRVDQITPNPDGGVILTLTMAFGENANSKNSAEIQSNGKPSRDSVSAVNAVAHEENVRRQLREESGIRKAHKMVPQEVISQNLLNILNEQQGVELQWEEICMEVAVSHPSLLFSSADSDYCEWESSCPGELFKIMLFSLKSYNKPIHLNRFTATHNF
jgi:hypothetical protein